jgi:hypothetical protein
MNTLNKEFTSQFFNSQEDYQKLRQHWSDLMASRTPLSVAHHALYCMLIGKDWRLGLRLPNNFYSDNHHVNESAIIRVLEAVRGHCCPIDLFKPFIKGDAVDKLRKLLPEPYHLRGALKTRESVDAYVPNA